MRAKVGDRVRMTGIMSNDPAPIPIGTTGTVTEVFGGGLSGFTQYAVDWDIDRSLLLLPEDPFIVIDQTEEGDHQMIRTCPRCYSPLTEHMKRPALSRVDNKTVICASCGTAEAMYEFENPGQPLPPLDHPVYP